MVAPDLGDWDPLSPGELAHTLAPVRARWWLAGGWALDLFLGRETRAHDDIDVQILRPDHLRVRSALADWDAHAVDRAGTLRPWPVGEELPPAVHDIWCRRSPADPWASQLMIADTAGGDGLVAVADGVGEEGGGDELCDGEALGLGCASASSLPAASSIAANRASVT